MIPKNPGITQKDTQKSGSTLQKVPKIMAHPHIVTYASYPPPPPLPKPSGDRWLNSKILKYNNPDSKTKYDKSLKINNANYEWYIGS